MRFMIIRRADVRTEAGEPGSEALFDAMTRYNEELVKAGVMLDGAGLQRSATGAMVDFIGGKPVVTDGPFAEAKELVAGYSIIRADSLDEAIEWVKRWPKLDGDGNVEIEIRQIAEAEDFDLSPELVEQEQRLRAKVAHDRGEK